MNQDKTIINAPREIELILQLHKKSLATASSDDLSLYIELFITGAKIATKAIMKAEGKLQ